MTSRRAPRRELRDAYRFPGFTPSRTVVGLFGDPSARVKEQFSQLWEYRREPWARKFFDQWRAALRWQRLNPFEKFAALIEQHWDGIGAYCRPENKVALGVVEGLNNKIRVIQRRCYGLRDEDYLHLKILTCTLPPLPRT